MTVLDLTTTEVVAALRQGDMTVSDYVTALTRQIRNKSDLNAFITFDEDLLGTQAAELDRRRAAGEDCGALFGLPIAIKDNIETADYVTTGGTGALKNHRPSHNAPFLQKLLNQGALVLGKTNLHELAFGITSNNSVFGPVRNPYNRDMIAGGSSGGSAAAVAARMAPFAIGTDTGGSTRIPPALCGITGFRPTMGRYGADGAVPIAHTRDTMGTMARTVADIQLIDHVVTGEAAPSPRTYLKGIRIGISRTYFYDLLDGQVEKATEKTLSILRDLGAELVEVDMDQMPALNEAISMSICLYEAVADMTDYLKGTGLTFDQLIAGMGSPDVKGLYQAICAEPPVSPEGYAQLLTEGRPKLRQCYRDYFADNRLDAMVFPTTKLTARPLGQDETVDINGREVSTFQAYVHNTDPSSNAGIPGVSVPMGMTEDGLPMGLEFDGPENNDGNILQIAGIFQQAVGRLPTPK